MRTLTLIALMLSSFGWAQDLTPVTFYFPKHSAGANVLHGYWSTPAHTVLDGTDKRELVKLEPGTFVTVYLEPGAHEMRVRHQKIVSGPIPVAITPKQRNFIRVTFQYYRNSEARSIEVVPCETARTEAEQMMPVAAKNIRVPMAQVVDTGVYFQPKCEP